MSETVKVFVSYSHQDPQYLEKESLLGYLKGLERVGVMFWDDRNIRAGELWDEVIKANIQEADIALVLVSQWFLDSEYCRDVEIRGLLAGKTHLFPVILSPCDWRHHTWLSRRQFLPGGDKTIEEHYTEPGMFKRLCLEIREQLRERVALIRQERGSALKSTLPDPGVSTPAAPAGTATAQPIPSPLSGPLRIQLCRRLGEDWSDLADYFGIPSDRRRKFTPGRECHGILDWLQERDCLHRLVEGLIGIGRDDLATLLKTP